MKSNEFVQETSGEIDMLDALYKDYSEEEEKRLSTKHVYNDQNDLLSKYANELKNPLLITHFSNWRNELREMKKYCANQETITLIDDLLDKSEEIQRRS